MDLSHEAPSLQLRGGPLVTPEAEGDGRDYQVTHAPERWTRSTCTQQSARGGRGAEYRHATDPTRRARRGVPARNRPHEEGEASRAARRAGRSASDGTHRLATARPARGYISPTWISVKTNSSPSTTFRSTQNLSIRQFRIPSSDYFILKLVPHTIAQ